MSGGPPNGQTGSGQAIPLLEWVAALLGALVVAAIAFVLIRDMVGGANEAPLPVVGAVVVEPAAGRFVVRAVIGNRGDRTAVDLVIAGRLLDGDRAIETAEATLDYLPPAGERTIGLLFDRDPDRYRLEVAPVAFVEP